MVDDVCKTYFLGSQSTENFRCCTVGVGFMFPLLKVSAGSVLSVKDGSVVLIGASGSAEIVR